MDRGLPKILYIAGIGRSGSTLLARVLGACPGFFAAGEMMHLFGRGFRRLELCGCGSATTQCAVWGRVMDTLRTDPSLAAPHLLDAFRRRVTEGHQLPALFLPWQPKRFQEQVSSLAAALTRAYATLGEVTGCRLVIDASKNPGYGRILTGIPGLEVYILHLVRDSRGVAYSLEKTRRRPGTAVEEYLDHHRAAVGSFLWSAGQVLVESLASRAQGYLRVRYRDFVRAPADTVRRVFQMVGESCGPAHLAHVREHSVKLERQHYLSGNDSRGPTGDVPLCEDLEWRFKMRPDKRLLVTALTGPLLYRYGYHRR